MVKDVVSQIFFDTIVDNGGGHSMNKKGNIVIHVISGPKDTIIVPIKDVYEELPGESVAVWLSQIGFTKLIPFLVPDHPAAEFIKKLP